MSHAPPSDAPTIYETGEYLANNPDWHETDAPYKAEWIAAFLKANKVDPGHIVEVGSGSGEILVSLARHFPAARLEGWDISPQAHRIALPKATDRLTFHHGEWQPQRADVTMAIDVFEHVPDYMGFIRTMAQAGGLKLFHIPLDLSVQGLLRGKSLIYARKTLGHLHYFCRDTALATLRDCGLEVIDWRYTHGAAELPNRKLRTRLFNVPRRVVRALSEDLAVRVMGGSSMLVLAR